LMVRKGINQNELILTTLELLFLHTIITVILLSP